MLPFGTASCCARVHRALLACKPVLLVLLLGRFGTTAAEAAKFLSSTVRAAGAAGAAGMAGAAALHFSPKAASFPAGSSPGSDSKAVWPLPSSIHFVRREFLSESHKAGQR